MIEFGELHLGETSKKHLLDVMATNWATAGPKVKEFEEGWGNLFGYKYNKAVSSGTDACLNAVASLYHTTDARPGDEVIVPALSFIATTNAVRMAGFTPVWVDVKEWTLNINPDLIEAAITSRTKAIMVVHTMGKPCKMDKIMEIAKKHNLKVIEDCCEAHGAKYKRRYVGTWGDAACFSFYTAHLICCGEGGMVSTNDELTAESVEATRSHGRLGGGKFFDHALFGFNSKMNDLEASLGLEGIEDFEETYLTRKANLRYLMMKTSHHGPRAWMNTENFFEDVAPHGFTITMKPGKGDIQTLQRVFDQNGVHWKRNFGCIPTQHGAYQDYGYREGDFPAAEWIGNNGIHVGTHQYLSKEDMHCIVASIDEAFQVMGD